jgi:hypothetical protein
MSNLEVRIRLASELRSMPLAEIPFRAEVISGVPTLLAEVGGIIGGVEFGIDDLSYQFTDDGEKAFLEVVVNDSEHH